MNQSQSYHQQPAANNVVDAKHSYMGVNAHHQSQQPSYINSQSYYNSPLQHRQNFYYNPSQNYQYPTQQPQIQKHSPPANKPDQTNVLPYYSSSGIYNMPTVYGNSVPGKHQHAPYYPALQNTVPAKNLYQGQPLNSVNHHVQSNVSQFEKYNAYPPTHSSQHSVDSKPSQVIHQLQPNHSYHNANETRAAAAEYSIVPSNDHSKLSIKIARKPENLNQNSENHFESRAMKQEVESKQSQSSMKPEAHVVISKAELSSVEVTQKSKFSIDVSFLKSISSESKIGP